MVKGADDIVTSGQDDFRKSPLIQGCGLKLGRSEIMERTDVAQALLKIAKEITAGGYYTFRSTGDLHRNVLLNTLEDEYGITFRDYDLSPTGIKAKNSKTEKVLKNLFAEGNRARFKDHQKAFAAFDIALERYVDYVRELPMSSAARLEMLNAINGVTQAYAKLDGELR